MSITIENLSDLCWSLGGQANPLKIIIATGSDVTKITFFGKYSLSISTENCTKIFWIVFEKSFGQNWTEGLNYDHLIRLFMSIGWKKKIGISLLLCGIHRTLFPNSLFIRNILIKWCEIKNAVMMAFVFPMILIKLCLVIIYRNRLQSELFFSFINQDNWQEAMISFQCQTQSVG